MSDQLLTVGLAGLLAGGFALGGGALNALLARKSLSMQLAHDRRTALDALRRAAYAEYMDAVDSVVLAVSNAQLAMELGLVARTQTLTLASERARLLAPRDTSDKIKEYSTAMVVYGLEQMKLFAACETPPKLVGLHSSVVVRNEMWDFMRRDLGISE